ncbi:O-antigen ligase family protein [Salinivibrio kushneri]|uniref:O-antigen ligase family protein n=1 Tax=Salinivibrio kushneri TaxID=1908198 RepID=UPI00098868FD|nr:O-antigen ligase family protein [Salinivibrio kushneri]OOE48890.1 hypothetical protein BZG12_16360 [Salinivibrio kushneri]
MSIKKEKMLALLLFLIFSPIIGFKIAITIKFWMLTCFFLILIKFKTIRLRYGPIYYIPTFFAVFAFFSLLMNLDGVNSSSLFFSFIPIVLFILCLTLEQFDFHDLEKAFRYFVKSYLILSFVYGAMGLYYTSSNVIENNHVYFGIFIQHLRPRFSGLVGDPNICAFYFSIIFCVAYSLRCNYRLLIVILLFILLTGSRTALAFVPIAVLFLYIRYPKYQTILLFGFPLIIYQFINIRSSKFTLSSALRIGEDIDLSRVGGRMNLWKPVFTHVTDHPFSLSGFGSGRSFSENVIGTPTYFHNSYLEIAYELGLPSLFIYIFIVVFILLSSKLRLGEKTIFFLAISIFALSLSIHLNEVLIFAFIFVIKFSNDIRRHEFCQEIRDS